MGFEPVLFVRPPLRLAWIELRARIGLCRCPAGSPALVNRVGGEGWDCPDGLVARSGWMCIATFCEVAICEDGVVRSAGRVPSTPEGIGSLAESLLPSDRVALEVTGSCWEVARILEPHVNRVVVVIPDDTGIASARAKTDKLDARTLASLLWKGELEAVWMPDERCRILRRRLARREQLVRARTRAKNEIHAVAAAPAGRPSRRALTCSGSKAGQWLAGLELPVEERESVDAGMRHIEFLDAEIAAVEQADRPAGAVLAGDPPADDRPRREPDLRRVVHRRGRERQPVPDSRKLVAYLGLDPKVKQSGEEPARSGRISKRGSASARWALVEAAWTAVLQPGPLHAFYERTKARRGHGKAIVATARKLAVLFWCMLTREEDYAHQQPSLTRKKLRRLEITAGAPKNTRRAAGIWSTNELMRTAELELAQPSRGLLQADGPRPARRRAGEESGRERDTGARIDLSHSKRTKPRGRPQAPDVCASLRHHPRPPTT